MKRPRLLHDLPASFALSSPTAPALLHKDSCLTFADLQHGIDTFGRALCELGLSPDERVAVYLPKQIETVVSIFGASAAGGVIVPINPLLKPQQVAYILKNCNVRVLVTSPMRAKQLEPALADCHDLNTLVLAGPAADAETTLPVRAVAWDVLMALPGKRTHARIDADAAGKPARASTLAVLSDDPALQFVQAGAGQRFNLLSVDALPLRVARRLITIPGEL